jgi:two-component system CheB/CheR fusion protein
MPGMDGYELIVALRERPATVDLPAIALTGFGRPLDARRALAAGFHAHLSKPVVLDDLLQTIHRLPSMKRGRLADGGD